MKYEVGDKVVMRVDPIDGSNYNPRALDFLKENKYIFTITKIQEFSGYNSAHMKETEEMGWNINTQVKELYVEPITDPINSRFEILDL